MSKSKILTAIIGIILFIPISLFATEFYVNSVTSFDSAQVIAQAGDIIIWQNGTYSNIEITISASGIVVRSETSGGVTFNGSSTCYITSDNITFSGFQYISGDIGTGEVIVIGGSHNILTELNMYNIIAKKYIHIESGTQYNEISYCNLEHKPVAAVIGCTIQISTSPTVPGYHKIRYCSFRNYPGNGGDNGNEPIRIGLGAESTNISRTIIEYCYFNNTGLGDSESISVKCRENIIRYCTQDNNSEGMFVFRNGNRNVAYGNFFINGSGGIRLKEANDIYCYNNYFETAGISGDMDAITFNYVSPNLNNINFFHNTFVNCGDIDLGGVGPTAVTFANNIFKKSSGNIFTSPNGQTNWLGNIYTGTLGIPIFSGMTNTDPLLTINSDGYYGLSSSSPAINTADPNYPIILDISDIDDDPSLLLDIQGQTRPLERVLKDIGCDEFTSGSITNRPLKLSDVGPSYLISSIVYQETEIPKAFQLFQNYPNPFNPTTQISYQISEFSKVNLKVFDVLGNLVATLTDGYKQPGSYQHTFNTHNFLLSSGIYFYRLEANDYVAVKKMLLIK